MASPSKQPPKHLRRAPTLALFLIGAGLVVLGGVSLGMLSVMTSRDKSQAEFSTVPYEVDYAAPETSLNDLEGTPVNLSDLRGRVVLVNHWATWCPPCRQEMPGLQDYYEAHKDQGFVTLAINQGETAETVRSFVQDYGLTFPVWLDPSQKSLAAFGYDGLPSSYVMDESGTVRLAWIGAISQGMLEKHVTPLIEE
jgi:peroxiredoxin